MAYDADFYVTYEKYLHEPRVRRAHDWVFDLVQRDGGFRALLDLGCGRFNEIRRFGAPLAYYLGVDANADPVKEERLERVSMDYRNCDIASLAKRVLSGGRTESISVVSLFSCEITAPWQTNYAFYEKIFAENPAVKNCLASGFFYTSRKSANPVEETGGIVSWQTLEDIDAYTSANFEERRIILPVPSEMFGEDLFEVWKVLQRR